MKLTGPVKQDIKREIDVINRMLSFDGKVILELGCGAADVTRLLAKQEGVVSVTAVEIDPIQYKSNLEMEIPKVTFKSYGAQEIEELDDSFDIVMLFKSLHHVPASEMDKTLKEIHRVLKPGGRVYFSEPVFEGNFNEVLRLFHDESLVRQQAFSAINTAVDTKLMDLEEEYFFKNIIKFQSFEQFESGILNITHTDFQLSEEILSEVKRRFMSYESEEGFVFELPNRIDLLKKTALPNKL
ncbi:MAG: class I SAM-dependent methyltransferase [Pseudomonadales bacterium]|nr:class I SAM-dependent methyltransferase [Pseudomonadales bacterium]